MHWKHHIPDLGDLSCQKRQDHPDRQEHGGQGQFFCRLSHIAFLSFLSDFLLSARRRPFHPAQRPTHQIQALQCGTAESLLIPSQFPFLS